jgi:hypothetical protein
MFLGENSPPNNDDVSYNNFFNAMILSRDAGEIYSTIVCNVNGCVNDAVTGTRIHHNWLHDTQSHFTGPADTYPLSGVYFDITASGFEVDQNVLWNNEYYTIQNFGNGLTYPLNNNIHNNSIPDVNPTSFIFVQDIPNCGTTQITNNFVLVPVVLSPNTDPTCTVTNNNSMAPGATEMNSSVQVGCNFAGCFSNGPPAISGSSLGAYISMQPGSVTVTAGQAATFSVTAAGSTPLGYQWQKNGVNISGATSSTYTTPATTVGDNGTTFTVQVSNPLGSVISNPATLTVN